MEDDPIELVEGPLLVAEPQHDPHARAVELAAETLRVAFGLGWRIRVQLPLALGPASLPEPDVAVVPGELSTYDNAHPTTAVLVVEVAQPELRLAQAFHQQLADFIGGGGAQRVLQLLA